MFKNAIVKRPGHSLVDGITSTPKLGKPNYEIAIKQHDAYIEALKFCGVEVTVLQADERFPDSCFLEKYGMTSSIVELSEMFHLKSGLAYLEDNILLVAGEFINNIEFKKFRKIVVDEDEIYSANCIRVNDYVLVPAGYPKIKEKIEKAGFKTIVVDTSEYRKVNGGLSCLSLRF